MRTTVGRVARWQLTAVLCGASLLVASACNAAPASPSPTQCGLIGADFGGCDPDRPAYTATTCQDLAREWGDDVDRRVRALIASPASVDGKAKSVRNVDILVLTSLVLTARLDQLDLHGTCDMARFWPAARAAFSEDLVNGAPGVLWDGSPATFPDWEGRAKEIVSMIDDGKPRPTS